MISPGDVSLSTTPANTESLWDEIVNLVFRSSGRRASDSEDSVSSVDQQKVTGLQYLARGEVEPTMPAIE